MIYDYYQIYRNSTKDPNLITLQVTEEYKSTSVAGIFLQG